MSTESSSDNGKLVAILSYFYIIIIGWIIALVIHLAGAKTKLGAYHLRQTLGLFIIGVIVGIVFRFLIPISMIFYYIYLVVGVCLLILWILGLIAAIKGEEKPVPVIGAMIQSTLGGLFN